MDLFELSATLTLDISGYESGIGRASQLLGDFGETMYNNGRMVEAYGDSIKAAFQPFANIGKEAIDTAIDYETAFTGVKKTIKGTEEEYAALSDGIKRMSTETASGKVEIAGVMETVGQLTDKIENVLPITETAVKLGDTTVLKAGDAATQLTRLMNIMGASGEEAAAYGSTIVELGNNMATDEKQILNMSLRIAGAGTTLGLTGDQVLALSAGLSSLGIRAESGGSSISRVLLSMGEAANTGLGPMQELTDKTGMSMRELQMLMENSPSDFRKLADSIGMTNTEMKNIVKGGVHLQEFADISGMTAEQFAKAMEEDAYGALLSFLGGLGNLDEEGQTAYSVLQGLDLNTIRVRDSLMRGAAGYEQMTAAADMANKAFAEGTALEDEAALRYGTTASQIHQVKESFANLMVEIGDKLLPVINKLLDLATPIIDLLSKIPTEAIAAVGGVAMIGTAVGGIVSTIGTAMTLLSGPGGWIALAVVAVAGLVAAVVANWDKISEFFSNLHDKAVERGQAVEAWLRGLGETITGWWENLWGSIGDWFNGVIEKGTEFFTSLQEKITGGLETAKNAINNFLAPIGKAFGDAWEAAKETTQEKLNAIKAAYDEHGGGMKGAMAATWEAIKGYYTAGYDFLDKLTGGKLSEIMGKVKEWITGIVSKVTEFIQNVKTKIEDFVRSIVEKFTKLKTDASEKIRGMIDDIKSKFEALVRLPVEWGRKLIDGFINGITEKWNALKSKVTGIVDSVKGWFTGSSGFDTHSPSRWAEKVFANVMQGGINGLQDGLPAMLRTADGITSDVKDALSYSPSYAGMTPQAVTTSASGGRDSMAAEIRALRADMNSMIRSIGGMQVVLDSGATVGHLTDPFNRSLGQQYVYAARGIA